MDGQMGFRDHDNAAYSMGVEKVEYALYDGCSACDRRFFHDFLDSVRIIEGFAITPIEFR